MKDAELLEKYNEIWEKAKNSIKRKVNREHVYNEKYLKGKKKCHNGKINTNFHNNKIPKECSQFFCLSVILINFVLGQVKSVILKRFQKNINMLPK